MRTLFETIITEEFEPHVNLKFIFAGPKDSVKSDVRVLFHVHDLNNENFSNFSALGTQARGETYVGKATMRINRVADDNRYRIVGILRHEIAHMFGMDHEHQHPHFDVPWKKFEELDEKWQKFYKDAETYKNSVVDRLTYHDTLYTHYDAHSITHYHIEPEAPSDFVHPRMQTSVYILSAVDLQTLRKMYPRGHYEHSTDWYYQRNQYLFAELEETEISRSMEHIHIRHYEALSSSKEGTIIPKNMLLPVKLDHQDAQDEPEPSPALLSALITFVCLSFVLFLALALPWRGNFYSLRNSLH